MNYVMKIRLQDRKINIHILILSLFLLTFCMPEYFTGFIMVQMIVKLSRVLYLGAMGIDLLIHNRIHKKVVSWLILYYFALMLATYFYSGMNIPLYRSLVKNAIFTILTLNYIAVYIKYYTPYFLKWMTIWGEIIAVLNLGSILLFPNGLYTTAKTGELCFLLGHKNMLLIVMIIPIFSSIIYYGIKNDGFIAKRSFYLVFIVFLSSVLSGASTVTICTILLLLFLWMYNHNIMHRMFSIGWCILGSIFLNLSISVFRLQNYLSVLIVDILHKNITLSNRTIIWDLALPYFQQNKIWGVGYEFWGTITEQLILSETHNMIIGVLFHMGLMGVMIWLIAFLNIYIRGKKYTNSLVMKVSAIIIFVYMIQGITEEITAPLQEVQLLLLLVLCYCLPIEKPLYDVRGEK